MTPSGSSFAARLGTALLVLTATAAAARPFEPLSPRADALGYTDPKAGGGSMLTIVPDTYPAGLGEPLNLILSSDSDAAVLANTADNGGFLNYALSLNFGSECSQPQPGTGQQANLGDGAGPTYYLATIRDNFGTLLGACKESITGGNHFRYWKQSSGAVFIAASMELPAAQQHDIMPNGYNRGRDDVVSRAAGNATLPSPISAGATLSGSTSYAGWTYTTDVAYVSGLLNNTSDGINHAGSVAVNGSTAIDGLVAVLTVKITSAGSTASTASGSSSSEKSAATQTLSTSSALTTLSFLLAGGAVAALAW